MLIFRSCFSQLTYKGKVTTSVHTFRSLKQIGVLPPHPLWMGYLSISGLLKVFFRQFLPEFVDRHTPGSIQTMWSKASNTTIQHLSETKPATITLRCHTMTNRKYFVIRTIVTCLLQHWCLSLHANDSCFVPTAGGKIAAVGAQVATLHYM